MRNAHTFTPLTYSVFPFFFFSSPAPPSHIAQKSTNPMLVLIAPV